MARTRRPVGTFRENAEPSVASLRPGANPTFTSANAVTETGRITTFGPLATPTAMVIPDRDFWLPDEAKALGGDPAAQARLDAAASARQVDAFLAKKLGVWNPFFRGVDQAILSMPKIAQEDVTRSFSAYAEPYRAEAAALLTGKHPRRDVTTYLLTGDGSDLAQVQARKAVERVVCYPIGQGVDFDTFECPQLQKPSNPGLVFVLAALAAKLLGVL